MVLDQMTGVAIGTMILHLFIHLAVINELLYLDEKNGCCNAIVLLNIVLKVIVYNVSTSGYDWCFHYMTFHFVIQIFSKVDE